MVGHSSVEKGGRTVNRSLLVLEDEEAIAARITASFEESGDTVVQAHSVSEATQLLNTISCDVVILDLGLFDESGIPFLKRLTDERPEITVVVVSASIDIDTRQRCYEYGAKDFVSKPFHPHELVRRVYRLLNTPDRNVTPVER